MTASGSRTIRRWLDRGHKGQVVISHDICHTIQMSEWGGHGYAHIYKMVLQRMLRRGFTQDEIDEIMIGTPRRLLTFI